MQLEQRLTTDELRQHIRMTKDPRMVIRFYAICLTQSGRTVTDVSKMTGYSRRTIHLWIDRYNRHGLGGLKDKTGRGKKLPLNRDQIKQLRHQIAVHIYDKKIPVSASNIRQIVKTQFNLAVSTRQAQKLLRVIGCRFKYISIGKQHYRSWVIPRRFLKTDVDRPI